MIFIAAVLLLLALAVGWLLIRGHANRSYVKGRRAPRPDGALEAEEKLFQEQMEVRLAYYRQAKDNLPEPRRMGETVVAADDFLAAEPILESFRQLLLAHPPARPLNALCVLKNWDYRAVWYLNGLSDIVKAAIYEESAGKTAYLKGYGVLVARADDPEGFQKAYFQQPDVYS